MAMKTGDMEKWAIRPYKEIISLWRRIKMSKILAFDPIHFIRNRTTANVLDLGSNSLLCSHVVSILGLLPANASVNDIFYVYILICFIIA